MTDRFTELQDQAMTAELALAPRDCWCPVVGAVIGPDADGQPAILEPARLAFVVGACPIHGTPAPRRWWQSRRRAERRRLENLAAGFR